MTEINGKRCLNQNHMAELLQSGPSDEPVIVLIEGVERQFTLGTLRELFEKQEFPNMPEDDEVVICSTNAILTILGIDYNWWNTTRRINKLFGGATAPKAKKKSEPEPTNNIVVGIAYEDFSDQQFFEGTRKQCVEWLNKNYQLYCIKAFFNKKVLVSLVNDEWKSIDEYVQEGRIVL